METFDYTGFSHKMVDKLFPQKRLTILAGKYSIGKTTFAANLGNWLCKKSKSVIYFSLAQQGKYIYVILKGEIGETIVKKENGHTYEINNDRFFVCDIPGISLDEIQLIIKNQNPDVIILDFLQLIKGSEVLRYVGRDIELKHLIDSLSELARIYNTRIIAISQVGRHEVRELSPSFEQSLPCRFDKDDRFIFSDKLIVIHGKYQVHAPGDIPKKLDKLELIKFFQSSDDADPVPTSYSFTYD